MLFCTLVGVWPWPCISAVRHVRRSKLAASTVPSDATNPSARSSLEVGGFADQTGKQTRRHICTPEQKSLSSAHTSPLFPSGSPSHVPPLRDVTRSQANPSRQPGLPSLQVALPPWTSSNVPWPLWAMCLPVDACLGKVDGAATAL